MQFFELFPGKDMDITGGFPRPSDGFWDLERDESDSGSHYYPSPEQKLTSPINMHKKGQIVECTLETKKNIIMNGYIFSIVCWPVFLILQMFFYCNNRSLLE